MSAWEGSAHQDRGSAPISAAGQERCRCAGGCSHKAAGAPGVGFGVALAAVKAGAKIARRGWNGRGMFIVYQAGYPDGIAINANTARATGITEGTVCRFLPYLMMRTADGSFVPWLASQTDILAEDWEVLP